MIKTSGGVALCFYTLHHCKLGARWVISFLLFPRALDNCNKTVEAMHEDPQAPFFCDLRDTHVATDACI